MTDYYTDRQEELLQDFDMDASRWMPLLLSLYGGEFTNSVLTASRLRFRSLIPQISYIGGEESWTGAFLESIRCLAFYLEMQKSGKTAEETVQILYEAILSRLGEPQPPLPEDQVLTAEQLMERRKKRAEFSQERRFPQGYVAEFIPGDGVSFDYGYNFSECAAQKFYRTQAAEDFLPYYCKLDFAYDQVYGLGLKRTTTLAEGGAYCDHRFKSDR